MQMRCVKKKKKLNLHAHVIIDKVLSIPDSAILCRALALIRVTAELTLRGFTQLTLGVTHHSPKVSWDWLQLTDNLRVNHHNGSYEPCFGPLTEDLPCVTLPLAKSPRQLSSYDHWATQTPSTTVRWRPHGGAIDPAMHNLDITC